MTQRAYPLNNTNYTAEDVRLFHVARCTGIFNALGNDLQVQANSGMNINVLPGYAFLLTSNTEKTGGFTYGSDAIEPLTVDVASSTDRYDYVSVRYSKTTNQANIKYVKGSGTRPTAPVRNANEYEIILAMIHVRANAQDIKGSDIIDCRLDGKYCGLVVDGTDRLDTSGFSQEFRSFMDEIKNILDENTAGNLLNEINSIKSNEQKPNLLINSDFKSGIINQRDIKEINNMETKRKYTIDMWSSWRTYVKQNDDYVTVRDNSGGAGSYFTQDFEQPIYGDLTLAVNLRRLVGSIEIYFDGSYNPQTITKSGLQILRFQNVNGGTSLSFAMKNADCDIEFIKLERGNVYTGMPTWNGLSELEKCQRYFYRRKTQLELCSGYMNGSNGDFVMVINLPIFMAKKPTVTFSNINQIYAIKDAEFHSATELKEIKDYGCTSVTLVMNCTLKAQQTISGVLIGEAVTIDFDSNIY